MITESIKCDACHKELIEDTPYPATWALRLYVNNVNRNTSGISYAVICDPPIAKPVDFCNFKCLINWLRERGEL
jgi:hypothetical protein